MLSNGGPCRNEGLEGLMWVFTIGDDVLNAVTWSTHIAMPLLDSSRFEYCSCMAKTAKRLRGMNWRIHSTGLIAYRGSRILDLIFYLLPVRPVRCCRSKMLPRRGVDAWSGLDIIVSQD